MGVEGVSFQVVDVSFKGRVICMEILQGVDHLLVGHSGGGKTYFTLWVELFPKERHEDGGNDAYGEDGDED